MSNKSAPIAIIADEIYALREQFQSVLCDKSINFDREAGFAVQVLGNSDYAIKIALGNRQSVINAVNNIAAIGISLNPAKKQAYLVPRDGKICLDISYMGLMDLAIDSGSIRWAQAVLVYETEEFVIIGYDKPPEHSRRPFAKEKGPIVGVYVVAKTIDGDYLTHPMSIETVFNIRERSAAWRKWISDKKSCPWVTDLDEMIKKTCVKQAYKYWPKTNRMDEAIHHLNEVNGEGLDAPDYDPALRDKWLGKVAEAETLEVLEATWKEAVKEINSAGDRPAYDAVKEAMLALYEKFKGPADPPPADAVPDPEFVAALDGAPA